ncbi:MAG: hypothetical protein PHV20_10120 [Bacteroidales bacterium]|nr:hypothetical protein [Bacteroidales bacterium]
MKTPIKVIIFYISAVLILVSSALFITKWEYAPYLFAFGSAGVASYLLSTPYTGTNFRVKRLRRFEIISAVLLVVTSYFMFKHRTEWIMTLSIAAFLLLYSSIVVSIEEKKEK